MLGTGAIITLLVKKSCKYLAKSSKMLVQGRQIPTIHLSLK